MFCLLTYTYDTLTRDLAKKTNHPSSRQAPQVNDRNGKITRIMVRTAASSEIFLQPGPPELKVTASGKTDLNQMLKLLRKQIDFWKT